MESDAPTESGSEAEDEILSTRSAGKEEGMGGVIFLYCKMYFYLIYIPTTSN